MFPLKIWQHSATHVLNEAKISNNTSIPLRFNVFYARTCFSCLFNELIRATYHLFKDFSRYCIFLSLQLHSSDSFFAILFILFIIFWFFFIFPAYYKMFVSDTFFNHFFFFAISLCCSIIALKPTNYYELTFYNSLGQLCKCDNFTTGKRSWYSLKNWIKPGTIVCGMKSKQDLNVHQITLYNEAKNKFITSNEIMTISGAQRI